MGGHVGGVALDFFSSHDWPSLIRRGFYRTLVSLRPRCKGNEAGKKEDQQLLSRRGGREVARFPLGRGYQGFAVRTYTTPVATRRRTARHCFIKRYLPLDLSG